MRVPAALVLLLFAPTTACGGGDDSGQCAGAPCAAGGTAGGAGASGATSTGGSGIGGSGNGGSGNGGSSAGAAGASPSDACVTIGGTLTGTQACYVSCLYDGSLVPNYDRNGDCTKFGSKCGRYNYCLPNITCTADKNCGTGRACVLGGECQIACATDADCPTPTSGAPLQCKPVDAAGILVCRPYP